MGKLSGGRRRLSVERRIKRVGWLFLLPWLVGLVFFFLIPFIQSVVFSFNRVSIGDTGLDYQFLGWENYRYILFEDADFNRNVLEQISGLAVDIPIILFFSVFVALLLNRKFRGRMFARSLFFLPVIIASGVVTEIIQNDVFVSSVMRADTSTFQTEAVSEVLYRLQFSDDLISLFTTVTSQVFDLSWKTGVPILLFLSALQSIPETYFEVASIEGVNTWDAFWKITFPVLLPTCLLVTVYAMVDSFTDMSNQVMKSIVTRFSEVKYGYASASAILYFAAIILVLLLIAALFFRKVIRDR